MSEPNNTQCEVGVKDSVIKIVLGPVTRIFSNEVSFILVVISIVMGYSIYWAAEQIKIQVPIHLKQLHDQYTGISQEFIKATDDRDKRYMEIRQIDEKNNERFERMVTGKKISSTGSPATSTQDNN